MASFGWPVKAAPTIADELWRLPDDGLRRELVRGGAAGDDAGRIRARSRRWDCRHPAQRARAQTGCGVPLGAETGFVVATDPGTDRAPDAAFVFRERAKAVGRTAKYWPGAPDLVADVVSPDGFREVEEKAHD